MTIQDIQLILNQYLAVDQPDIRTAEIEIRDWLRTQQLNGEVHAFLVHPHSGKLLTLNIQCTASGATHTLQFIESDWLKTGHLPPPPATHSTSSGTDAPVIDMNTEKDDEQKAYERAMGILL